MSYCSGDCQKKHWRQHKPRCRPFKLTPVAGKGLGLVATRLIKRSEVIIRENPTLVKRKGGDSLIAQFNKHTEKVKNEILELHHDNPEDSTERRLEQIFISNACDVRRGAGVALYPTIPRINDHLVGYSTGNSAKSSNFKHPFSEVKKFITGPCDPSVAVSCSCIDLRVL